MLIFVLLTAFSLSDLRACHTRQTRSSVGLCSTGRPWESHHDTHCSGQGETYHIRDIITYQGDITY